MGFGLVGIWWAIATSMAVKGVAAVSFLPYLKRTLHRRLA